MATQTLVTPEQFDHLPQDDDRRLELLDGEVIEMPNPTGLHSRIVVKAVTSLENYFEGTALGTVVADTDIQFGQNRLRPDLAVLLTQTWRQADPSHVPLRVTPEIAGEVISPSESAGKVNRKINVYLASGVAEVWVMYPDSREVHVFTPNRKHVEVLAGEDSLTSPLLPGWALPLMKLFP